MDAATAALLQLQADARAEKAGRGAASSTQAASRLNTPAFPFLLV